LIFRHFTIVVRKSSDKAKKHSDFLDPFGERLMDIASNYVAHQVTANGVSAVAKSTIMPASNDQNEQMYRVSEGSLWNKTGEVDIKQQYRRARMFTKSIKEALFIHSPSAIFIVGVDGLSTS